MASIEIRQSVFDRLTGADLVRPAGGEARPPRTTDEAIALRKRNLLRDLEQLLNSRQISDVDEIEQELLRASVYTYGLPDLSSYDAATAGNPEGLQRAIKLALRNHEPRLRNVRVTQAESEDRFDRLVRFHIEGDLVVEPDMERVEFDTVLRTSTKRFEVQEETPDE